MNLTDKPIDSESAFILTYSIFLDEQTRVSLKMRPGEVGSDYINASFIDVSIEHNSFVQSCTTLFAPYSYFFLFFFVICCLVVIIQGYCRRKVYIATQAPLPCTLEDYWRMIWEQGSCVIVMLTKEEEAGKVI